MISALSSLTDRDSLRQSHLPGMRPQPTIGTWCRVAQRVGALLAFLVVLAFAQARPAFADFRVCNNTASRVGVAIGYKDKDGWATEGGGNLSSRGGCEILLPGPLSSR